MAGLAERESLLPDLQLLDASVQGRRRQSEPDRRSSRPGNPSAALSEGRLDHLPLELSIVITAGVVRLLFAMAKLETRNRWQPQAIDAEYVVGTQYHGSLDHVLQLADITRPLVVVKEVQCLFVNACKYSPYLVCIPTEEVLKKYCNIFPPFSKRRDVDRKNI